MGVSDPIYIPNVMGVWLQIFLHNIEDGGQRVHLYSHWVGGMRPPLILQGSQIVHMVDLGQNQHPSILLADFSGDTILMPC
ncbi:hypothetical protein FKM82_028412 [Ascaphus truei]